MQATMHACNVRINLYDGDVRMQVQAVDYLRALAILGFCGSSSDALTNAA